MATARWLVTGGAGFIGSNIAARLVAAGERVRILDNLVTGRWWLLDRLVRDGSLVEKIEGDIRDPAAVAAAMDGVEVVFHEAALGSVPRSIEQPRESDAVNVNGTVTVLDAARNAGVRRVVFAASSSAYGDSPTLPKLEDMPVLPLSPYAVTKVAGEAYLRVFAELYGIDTVSLRYFNVFGPNQLPSGAYAAAIPRFVWAALHDQPITIYGDGEQTRDFCFVDNVVDANLHAAKAAGRLGGQVVNVAGGRRITLNELVAEIGRVLGRRLDVRHVDARAGDIRHSLADVSRARSVLGFEAAIPWEDGIPATISFLRELSARRGGCAVRSMTGFGLGEAPLAGGKLVAEIRGVNGRFLDVRVRLPREILDHSMFVEHLVRERLSRGRYEIGVRAEGPIAAPPRIDRQRARVLLAELVALRDELAPGEAIPLASLLAHPELLGVDADPDASAVRESLREAVEGAFAGLAETCAREGQALARDLDARIERVATRVREIAALAPGAIETQQRRRVVERLARLLEGEGGAMDAARVEQEVALLVIRADVAEETTRLAIHLGQMREWLASDEPVGRRLDFLLQEMGREINTVGSKSQDAAIARAVVDVKAELERMREQVQNVE